MDQPTAEMESFFERRTKEHIQRVRRCLMLLAPLTGHAAELRRRAAAHDASKFGPDERVPYIWLTEYHRCRQLGEPFCYPRGMEEKVRTAIQHHVTNNRHHPEFHGDPNEMSDVDLIEMVCDWTAMAQEFEQDEGSARGWAEKTIGERLRLNADRREFVYQVIALLDSQIAADADGDRCQSFLLGRSTTMFPSFPPCQCEFDADAQIMTAPEDALRDPFQYLPAPVEFTPELAVLAERYRAHEIDWKYYAAYQAAAFLQPKTRQQHDKRREQFLALKTDAEAEGFQLPESLTRLYLTDAYIDRLHHNCVWPSLPESLVRMPNCPDYAVMLFLIEGQGGGIWHLLLSPDGGHTVVNVEGRLGCVLGYPPGKAPDPAKFKVFQCMDTVNRLLYHYFTASACHDEQYVQRLEEYFAETGE